MTPQQTRRVKQIAYLGAVIVVAFAVVVCYALWIEKSGVVEGGSSTISDLARLAWAEQPGAILAILLLVTNVATYVLATLSAHWHWAGKATYRQLVIDSNPPPNQSKFPTAVKPVSPEGE